MFARWCLLAIAIVVYGGLPDAHGCTCSFQSGGCSESWKSGDVIFLGKVTRKTLVEEPMNLGGRSYNVQRYAVQFSELERFRGAGNQSGDILVFTGMGGGDCGYPFVVGTTYLVYAGTHGNQDGRLGTGICSGTQPEATARAVLGELRAVARGERADDLFGIVAKAPKGVGYEDLVETEGLAGVHIRAIGSSGAPFSVVTDATGTYAFPWLPADTYRVEQDLPGGLTTSAGRTGRPVTVEVILDAKGAGCELNALARPDGQISGRIVDRNGNPIDGFITVEPAEATEREAAQRHGGLPGDDTKDGKFMLSQIPPGKYWLVFRLKTDFRHAYYWPRADSPIDLGFGQHLDGVRVEPPLPAEGAR